MLPLQQLVVLLQLAPPPPPPPVLDIQLRPPQKALLGTQHSHSTIAFTLIMLIGSFDKFYRDKTHSFGLKN